LKITLLFFLLPHFKIWGVIMAVILTDLGGALFSFFVFKKTGDSDKNYENKQSSGELKNPT
jgi:hypothetical protein